MDEIPVPPPTVAQLAAEISTNSTYLCPQCHLPVRPDYYFCPNCGKNLRVAPATLPTDSVSQILLYGFSIVLPIIAYLAITKWQGIKYIRSSDDKARQIGYIALGLLVLSSIVVFWWTYVWIQQYIASSLADLNNYPGL